MHLPNQNIHLKLETLVAKIFRAMEQRGMVLLAGNSHPDLADLVARHLDSRLGNSSVSVQATIWLKCRQIYSKDNQDFLVLDFAYSLL